MTDAVSLDPHAAISYEQAESTVAAYAARLEVSEGIESVPLLAALGRVLARPVLADRDQPPFARSTRDGFACRVADLAGGVLLPVIGLLRAGQVWSGPLGVGDAIEIMTGAPLPAGADSVVMVEHVVRTGAGVRLAEGRTVRAGDNYIPVAAEARMGDPLVEAGTRLAASHIAAAASAGAARVPVYARPRVAILSTGDELVPVEAQPAGSQIRNSNSYSLAAQVLALGGEPVMQPVAADSTEALERAVRLALEPEGGRGPDLLLLSGGVSMGKYDLVEEVLAMLGARFFFTGVRMQPGKPVVFGEIGRRSEAASLPFFGLPGNPVSTMVTFALFVAPVLAALGGERGYARRFVEARLGEDVARKPGLCRFLPARVIADASSVRVAPVSWQGSGDLAGTAQANCLLVVPETEPGAGDVLSAAESVRILLL